jgi:hypothetical protein
MTSARGCRSPRSTRACSKAVDAHQNRGTPPDGEPAATVGFDVTVTEEAGRHLDRARHTQGALFIACRTHESAGGSALASGAEGRASLAIPSHTRYAAPTTVSTVSTVSTSSERATRAATPAATAAVAAKCPTNNPPTAGNTVRCRSPAAIAYAQSAPGVNTNNNDTAQNATTVPTVMTSPILVLAPVLC